LAHRKRPTFRLALGPQSGELILDIRATHRLRQAQQRCRAAPEIVGRVVGNLVRPNNNPNVYETIPKINAAGVLP
jgi:hypothetical protein